MKITAVRLFEVRGEMSFPGEFWEERLVRPVDIYPEYKARGAGWLPKIAEGRYEVRSMFLQIETDEGVTGLGGPASPDQAYIILQQIAPMLIDQDPLAIERIWDIAYRNMIHGRKGPSMMALSVVDCALWDLKGKWAGAPVYRLLGGPTRDTIPAYASALGYSLEPGLVRRRAQEMVQQGYKAMKWFFRHGPTDGVMGIAKNVELVRTLREAVGPDVDIMLDCWSSWDVPYTIQMARRLEQYHPCWLEEPVLADKIAQYAEIRRSSPVPIAGGEHEYTRWGLKALMDAGACDVLQPDIYWAGGISEMQKICALASAYDLPVIPHGHSVPATVHLIAAWPVTTCPLLEYLIKWNTIHQFFLKNPIVPVNGQVTLPTGPGIGMELDESKILDKRDISFGRAIQPPVPGTARRLSKRRATSRSRAWHLAEKGETLNHQEGYFRGVRGARIYYQVWLPDGEPQAALLIVHGLAEHSGRYAHVAARLASSGYGVYAPDLVGHGRSEGARAYVRRFGDWTDTVATCLGLALDEQPGKPVYLLGHSLGATIAACCFLDGPSGLAGGVLSGVSVRMPDNITPVTILLAKVLSALAPRAPVQRLEAQWISRDPAVVQAYVSDPLVYTGKICARTGIELLKAQQRILAQASGVQLPVLMVHGSDDLLCPLDGARPFYEAIASTDKTLQVYDGLYHEVYNEPEREQVLDDVAAWLEARLGSP